MTTSANPESETSAGQEENAAALAFQGRLLDAAGESIIATDLDGVVTYANKAAERMFGWGPGEMLGRSAMDDNVPQEGTAQAEQIMQELRAGRSWSGEFEVRRRDGQRFPAQTTNTPVFDKDGSLIGIIGVSHDVTERHRVEQHQAAGERWFRAVVSRASELIFVVDAAGALRYANPAAEQVMGYPPSEQDGRDLFQRVHPDDREHLKEVFGKVMREPGPDEPVVWRFRTADRGWRTFESVRTNCLDDPAIAGVVVNARDITEAHESRAAMEVNESLLREAQRISHVGHWRWDPGAGRVEWLSDEMFAIHGVPVGQWAGTVEAYYDLVLPEDHHLLDAAAEDLFTTGATSHTIRVVRPDGTIRHVRSRNEAIFGDDGAPVLVVGTCQDVTEQEERRRDQQKRVKELTCLVAVSQAVRDLDDIAEVCTAATVALVLAMHHPDLAVAAIELDGCAYGTAAPSETGEWLTTPIVVGERTRGQVRVGYPAGHTPFPSQERALVQSVAMKLALWLETRDAGAALAESESRFRRLVDNAADVVFRYRLGAQEGLEYVSPSVEALTGYTVDEVLADPTLVQQLVAIPGHEAAADGPAAPVSLPGSKAVSRLVARDGSVRWIECNLVPVQDDAGRLVAVEGVARDVTDRIVATGALEARVREQAGLARFGAAALTTERLQDLLDLAVMVIADALPVDAAAISQLLADDAVLVLAAGVGWPDGVVGTARVPSDTGSMAAAALAQDAPVVVPDLSAERVLRSPFLIEHGMVSGMSVVVGGKEAPFGALGVFSRTTQEYSDGQVRFLQTVAHMLGAAIEGLAAEAARARREREFRSLAEHLPDLVTRYGRDHRYRYINARAETWLGLPPAAFIGKTNRELGFPPDQTKVWEDAADGVFATGEPATVETHGDFGRDHSTLHWQSLLIPELDSDGSVGTVLGVTRDITSLRRVEEQRREGLARIVAAQEEERARIGEDIHDDSIQVMTAVGMRIEGLKRMATDPEVQRLLQPLEEAVRHSIGRLRALMFELRPPELDRDGLCTALRLYLEATSDGPPPWQVVDDCARELPVEVRIVLYRIAVEAIVNTRKHAQASHLEVVVTEVDGGVRMEIRDDGQGFDPDDLADIGPHHIGTTTMYERAEAAGGTTAISSTPGQGTTVSAWMPCPEPTTAAP
ncbi:MAG TPA: PAS domain S-box protein [Egibacteraceae bacterium]|nr:PAS domain S-box protein [Egibacteraceae bacterium]